MEKNNARTPSVRQARSGEATRQVISWCSGQFPSGTTVMAIRVLTASGLVFALLAPRVGQEHQASAVFDPHRGSLARDEPQAIYAPDPADAALNRLPKQLKFP